jgi:hypothetical protein
MLFLDSAPVCLLDFDFCVFVIFTYATNRGELLRVRCLTIHVGHLAQYYNTCKLWRRLYEAWIAILVFC